MTTPPDDLTADAIRARTGEGCQRCGLTDDRTCYLPAARCPRVETTEKENRLAE